MKASARLFLRKGVAATSVDDIVSAADVAKGTFYLYFPSKQHVLTALQARFVEDMVQAIEAAMAERPADDWRGRLEAWATAGVDFYLDQFRLHEVLFHSGSGHTEPQPYNLPDPLIEAFTGLLRKGMAAGAWRVEDPEMTAVGLYHAMHGLLDFAVARGMSADRAGLSRAVADFYRRAVRPD